MKRHWLLTTTLAACATIVLGGSSASGQQRGAPVGEPAVAPLQKPTEQTSDEGADLRKPDAESQAEAAAASRVRADDQASDQASPREPSSQEQSKDSNAKKKQRPSLGLTFHSAPTATAAGQDAAPQPMGLVIEDVAADSLADKAGLQAKDRIVQVDGYRFRNARQLQAYLANSPGGRAMFVFDRGGETRSIPVMLPDHDGGAWLGVYLKESQNQPGAVVTNVYPGSPAARAGMRPGDIITKLGDQSIADAEALVATVDEIEPQAKVQFTVVRNDQELQLAAQLASRQNVFYRGPNPADEGRGFAGPNAFAGPKDVGREFDDIPLYEMQLEHDRRSAEQRQRIEAKLDSLRQEVQELRELLQAKKQ